MVRDAGGKPASTFPHPALCRAFHGSRQGLLDASRGAAHDAPRGRPSNGIRMFLLIPYPEINPVWFHIGPVPIRWYALAYIAGLVFGWAYVRLLVGREQLWGIGQPRPAPDSVDDLIVYIALGIILGGRLGYVL